MTVRRTHTHTHTHTHTYTHTDRQRYSEDTFSHLLSLTFVLVMSCHGTYYNLRTPCLPSQWSARPHTCSSMITIHPLPTRPHPYPHPILCYTIPNHSISLNPVSSYPVPSYTVPSNPILSYPLSSFFIPYHPIDLI